MSGAGAPDDCMRRVNWSFAGLVAFGLAALGSGVYRFVLHGGLPLRNAIQA